MKKPTIVIFNGAMGSGKSTITGILKEKLPEYVFVDRAYIKDIMLKHIKKKNPELARTLSRDVLFLIMDELIKNKHNILLQEIRASSIEKKFGKKLKNYKIKSFYLHISLEESKLRDSIRQKRLIRPDIVEKTYKKYAFADEKDITINTQKNNIKKTVKIILDEIK
jgi:adenylylsulfate kinase-like enzyme